MPKAVGCLLAMESQCWCVGQSVMCLTALEVDSETLDPAQILEMSNDCLKYNAAILYLESQRSRNMPIDTRIDLGCQDLMNVVPYQLDQAIQLPSTSGQEN